VHFAWQPGEKVQARRSAHGLKVGEMTSESGEERVAPATVDGTNTTEVAIELAARHEVGESELIDRRRALVGRLLHLGDRLYEPRREDEPAEAEPRREDLARRACVDDVIRAEALDRPDRLTVVAELRVVIV